MGVHCQELAWQLSPSSPSRLAIDLQKKAAFPLQTRPYLGPIIHSGLSFGISFSACPQTQTLVAVCFSTHRQLPADPQLVSRPCRPINNLLGPCAGSEFRATHLFTLQHRCLLLSLLSACLCLDSMGCPRDPRCFKCKDGFTWAASLVSPPHPTSPPRPPPPCPGISPTLFHYIYPLKASSQGSTASPEVVLILT